MEAAMVYQVLQYTQYAVPVGIVLLCAVLVFVFGFKKAEQPPFAQLSTSDVDRKLGKKRGKVREKRTANGSINSEKASPTKKSVPVKTESAKKAAKVEDEDNKLKEKKQEDNKTSGKKEKNQSVNKIKEVKENKTEHVKNKKNLKNIVQEKPLDFDEGDWEQAYSRKDKKNKKKEEESPSKKNKKSTKKADIINEAAKQKDQEKPEIKDKTAKETENKELKEKDKKEIVLTPILNEELTKEKYSQKEEPNKTEKAEKEEKKKPKKAKKASESETTSSVTLTPKKDDKPIENVVQTKGEETDNNSAASIVEQMQYKTGPVFDELGDVWKEPKQQKKSKKKARKE
ncbi:uncharacterized protein AH6.3-like [Prorops nasuta]|uniref:uncharacterized protein AH6.3-like n=1 Tax=Prorops nasuta TaxID=863751 RepID=UPI0034CF5FCD